MVDLMTHSVAHPIIDKVKSRIDVSFAYVLIMMYYPNFAKCVSQWSQAYGVLRYDMSAIMPK